MNLKGKRIIIKKFTKRMAKDVHLNSLDDETRKYLPDEVFESVEEARDTIEYLMTRYSSDCGPFVYPILLKTKENIGYVQLNYLNDDWEIGFHIAKKYRNLGYASEAVQLFLPAIMKEKHIEDIEGICMKDNVASRKVLEKCNFELVYEGRGDYQGERCEICVYKYQK